MIPRCTLLVLALLSASVPGRAQCPPSPALVEAIVENVPAASEAIGYSVALCGDTLALTSMHPGTTAGGPWSVHLFDRDAAGVWGEVAEVTNPDGFGVYFFGPDLALDGNTLFVGDPTDTSWEGDSAGAATPFGNGVVHVFERDHGGPNAWGESQTLLPPDPTSSFFGVSVAVDGDTLVVGASSGGPGGAGAAFVYTRLPDGWRLAHAIPPFAGASLFGADVAVGPGRIVIGAERSNNDVGLVGVYEQDASGAWVQTALLQPAAATAKLFYGAAVALSGDRIAVGAPCGPVSPPNPGRVRIYDLDSNGTWNLTKVVKPKVALSSGAHFGNDVALDGDALLVTGPDEPGDPAWAFFRNEGGTDNWGSILKHTSAGSHEVVAIEGERALIGDPGAVVNGLVAGAGYLYEDFSPVLPEKYCTPGTSSSGCTATLSSTGCASATDPKGFVVTADGVEGGKDGLYFFGTQGRQANPWGNGTSFQCVAPPVQRCGLLAGSGTPGACDGVLAQDINAHWKQQPAQNPGAGALVQAQLWYRDPLNTSDQTTSLSDAIEFTIVP